MKNLSVIWLNCRDEDKYTKKLKIPHTKRETQKDRENVQYKLKTCVQMNLNEK